jgi:hypothetical protein
MIAAHAAAARALLILRSVMLILVPFVTVAVALSSFAAFSLLTLAVGVFSCWHSRSRSSDATAAISGVQK